MAGFNNDIVYGSNVDFRQTTPIAAQMVLDGQLLIASSTPPHAILAATLTAGAGITITNASNSITIAATGGVTPVGGLTPDAFTAPGTSPVVGDGSGNIVVTGAQVAAGVVGTNVIRTDSLAANTMTIEIQRATTAAVSTPADNGVSHFDSTIFTVGAGGFVSLVGGAVPPTQKFDVDANTGPGTDPVVPTAAGVVTITGAQVATGVIGANVIRTDSLAANTITIEIQRSTAVAASDTTKNGVSHFDNTIFTVGAGGFVSLVGGAVPPAQKFNVDANTPPGTDPVVADATGVVNITGGQVATGTIGANVIRTNSTAANSYAIEIQRSTAVAGSDSTKNGVSHFNSAQFTVDANGFVSSTASGGGAWQLIETQNPAGVTTVTFNTNLTNFTELLFIASPITISTADGSVSYSADNGVTLVLMDSARVTVGSGGANGTGITTKGFGFFNTGTSGMLRFYNLPGTVPRTWSSVNCGGGNPSNLWGMTAASAIINWVQFNTLTGGTYTGTITAYGR